MAQAPWLRGIAAEERQGGRPDEPCLLVVVGADGDLARRRLLPALANLAREARLPPRFAFLGVGTQDVSEAEYRELARAAVARFTTGPPVDASAWEALAGRLHYLPGRAGDPQTCVRLAERAADLDAREGLGGNVVCYLAVAPALYAAVSANLRRAGLGGRAGGWTRLVLEKPVGPDLASAARLNRALLADWSEDQLYRVDPYLQGEAAWNVLAFRFGDGPLEPLWDRAHIDHIQLTLFDPMPVESRGVYLDRSGLLGDLVHLLAFFCMERPASGSAEGFRDERVRLLRAVRRLSAADVAHSAVRGQYGAGAGRVGYRGEPGVDPDASAETFAALRLFIDNERWQGVPVYLRAGRAVSARATYAVVEFKAAPAVPLRDGAVARLAGNRLLFPLAPGGAGYEGVLRGCLRGDLARFLRTDLVEAACRIVQPIQDEWARQPASFPNYAAGTSGPREADELLARDGRRWVDVADPKAWGRAR